MIRGNPEHWEDNGDIRKAIFQLEILGLTDRAIAEKCKVSPPHLSRVKNGARKCSSGLRKRILRMIPERIEEMVKSFNLDFKRLELVAQCKGPGVPFGEEVKEELLESIRAYLLGSLLGISRSLRFPKGMSGVLVRIEDARIALVDENDANAKRALIHELEALIKQLREEVKSAGNPSLDYPEGRAF